MAQNDQIKVLFLFPEWLWRTKQSPSRRNYVRAIAEKTDWKLSGAGFSDWNESLSAMQNIEQIHPGCQAIYGYKLGGTERGSIKGIEECRKHMVVSEAYNECWAGTTTQFGGVMHPGGGTVAQEARKAGLNLLIHHHKSDYPRLKELEGYCQLSHIRHCAPKLISDYALPWEERSGVVLTGSMNEQHYPLRCRLKRMIDSGKIKGTYYQRPPNYTKSVEASDDLVLDYARVLGSHKVKLGCASVWGYALQHYSEAAMCGCVHVADETDDADTNRLVWAISNDMTDMEIIQHINSALESGVSAHNQRLAHSTFSTQNYADEWIALVRKHAAFVE